MKLPGSHSLFWRLALLQVGFCVSIIWLTHSWAEYVDQRSYFLTPAAREQLSRYAEEAERAWRSAGRTGIDRWLAEFGRDESSWAAVVGPDLRSLGSRPLLDSEYANLTFMRRIDWPMSRRMTDLPHVSLPFPEDPEQGRLVVQLPERFLPSGSDLRIQLFINVLVPGLLALLLCGLIYRQLSRPLAHLRAQANALRGDRLDARVAAEVSVRRDELGELARAFDHMAGRLEGTVAFQRQLLRDLSHELRTPLSRLRVATEREADIADLRQRLEHEVAGMEKLVGDTLELVWLDTERPALPLEDVQVAALWELLRENACFETGWSPVQLPCALGPECRVRGHLNGLAQAVENILRNAIRHSPPGGTVRLDGRREEGHWHLWVEDQGPGVEPDQLEMIFQPFTRLSAARPGNDGFGLGLAIARSMVRLQGGELWAENASPGLRLHLRLAIV
ncbi:two-component sensor histidine kinase [Pseudomonas sp. PIC25]|uniref:sensor histidine kinase n=1 Tax=Pseudomonas sp. PIC25 TaxID=1958773 RepID=UPI000BABFE91|nr:sensor histidine kinase [Pseudomonas sp. PIC25]PAU63937.1 two-component sensor histidine kinase [Pseudomonas sp. PIC25]